MDFDYVIENINFVISGTIIFLFWNLHNWVYSFLFVFYCILNLYI